MNWDLLRAPFRASDIDFRPGATTKDKTKAIGLAYVDKRIYEDRLDEFIGAENWSVEYRQIGDKGVICRLTIYGVVREDVGEFASDDVATFPTAVAQAFKRACSAFGLGRYLYSLPQVWAEYDADRRRFTDAGMAHLRKSLNVQPTPATTPAPTAVAAQTKPSASPVKPPQGTGQNQRMIARIESLLEMLPQEQKKANPQWRNQSSEQLIEFGKYLADVRRNQLVEYIESLMIDALGANIDVDMPIEWQQSTIEELLVMENQLKQLLAEQS